ncbi:hypothetical protein [Actinomadura sp. GTD37]|uniref:hypothetical protein n=1 Tax=Actinomadura sp. GTD37 TaxID=1778030 RepID=UPI0035C1CCF1
MSVRFGLSSGSAPRLEAHALAALVRGAGGTVADLRAGKGHRWEDDGVEALCGLAVAFVGISVVLGRPRPETAASGALFPGLGIKVFAAPGSVDAPSTAEQIRALTLGREPEQVLVETHRGGAAPDELVELCRRYGCRLVVDNLGLTDITGERAGGFGDALGRLAPWTAAVQVKGFTPGTREHRPLREDDLGWVRDFAGARVDITVESRAGTPHQDLTTLRTAWRTLVCA